MSLRLARSFQALLLAGTCACVAAAHAANVGTAAPAFSAIAVDGKPVKLADFQGRYVVLEWLNPECKYVEAQYEAKRMQKLQKDWTARNVAWLTLATAPQAKPAKGKPVPVSTKMKGWMGKHDIGATAVIDDSNGAVSQLYGIETTPEVVVINPAGTIIYSGAIDDHPTGRTEDAYTAKNYVREALAQAMEGFVIAKNEVEPYGCPVR